MHLILILSRALAYFCLIFLTIGRRAMRVKYAFVVAYGCKVFGSMHQEHNPVKVGVYKVVSEMSSMGEPMNEDQSME